MSSDRSFQATAKPAPATVDTTTAFSSEVGPGLRKENASKHAFRRSRHAAHQ